MAPDEINVNGDQHSGECREKQHVKTIEPGKRYDVDTILSSHQPLEIRADDWSLRANLGCDNCSPVRAVIPRQEITCEAEANCQEQQPTIQVVSRGFLYAP